MDSTALRELQAPLKQRYREEPETALVTLRAEGRLSEGISCSVQTGRALVEAGLHPATGGDGVLACSGDMLLEALVACAGVTMKSVATAIEVEIVSGTVSAEGRLDFRGTLAVDKQAPVGFVDIGLHFAIESPAPAEKLAKLVELTERFCVVYQTLKGGVSMNVSFDRLGPPASGEASAT
ncbi:MAG TPA: OsmC family protein [Trueperaceae bacterium]|nr:OsmC family protein [Trueperaceae bacterium]